MPVPNTDSFSQRDVVTEIYGDSSNRSLTELYTAAIGYFDPSYVGSKNSLYNFRNYQHVQPNGGYGRIYNWRVIKDSRNVAPNGWHVPTIDEWYTLTSFLGRDGVSGGKLKEIGTSHWSSPNTDATDIYGFSGVGSGYRSSNGNFYDIKIKSYLFGTELYRELEYNSPYFIKNDGLGSYNDGISIRLIKDDSINTGIMTDNSGYTYKTVKIGDQIWMASNLRGTKYRNGDDIPIITDNSAWSSTTSGACCSYGNNDAWSYADNYVVSGTNIRIELHNNYDGGSYYSIYLKALNIIDNSLVAVNTNVTVSVFYIYFDGTNYNSNTVDLTINSGTNQSSPFSLGGPLVDHTLVSITPTSSGTYNYTI